MIRATRFLAVLFLAGFAAATAQATVINVQFGSSHNSDSPLYVGTAAAPDTGTVWNELREPLAATTGPYSSGALTDSFSGSTSVTYTIGGATGTDKIEFDDIFNNDSLPADYSSTGAPNLARSQVNAVGTNIGEILISGLDSASRYDLYFYSERGLSGYVTQFTVTDASGSQSLVAGNNNSTTTGFNTPEDYVRFSGLAPTTFTASDQLIITFSGTSGFPYGATNGFQLVVETPEPASLVLFGLGAIGLLWGVGRPRSA